ncbi:MAG: hypothetical protein NC938_03595 [Candidatus Omnitrophica bacterium]|nr:hypothetical protein [Candidatus Omnitrophota bacterium]MCM8790767.1 hypothetical protein [Candidatus Omnitrophota bacterium]
MKMVMIAYNMAIDEEVMEVLTNCALKSYTKFTSVYGKGESSGTHLGNDIWPGLNNVMYVSCTDTDAKQLISCIGKLRSVLGKEGIKAFVWDLTEVT